VFRPKKPPSLLGKWYGRVNGEPVAIEFLADDRMAYVVQTGGKTQVMRLTFRTEGDALITNQPSAPREERSKYHFDGDALVVEFGGEQTRFARE